MAYSALILPVTMMIIFTAQLLWVWHSMADFTNQGARYATTHCWQSGSDNVRTWMRQNAPLTSDRDQFVNGPAEITIDYFGKDADTGQLTEFSCDGGDCSSACVPAAVRVRITGYEYRGLFTYLGLPPLAMPDFQTTLAVESAGCGPDSQDCTP